MPQFLFNSVKALLKNTLSGNQNNEKCYQSDLAPTFERDSQVQHF